MAMPSGITAVWGGVGLYPCKRGSNAAWKQEDRGGCPRGLLAVPDTRQHPWPAEHESDSGPAGQLGRCYQQTSQTQLQVTGGAAVVAATRSSSRALGFD